MERQIVGFTGGSGPISGSTGSYGPISGSTGMTGPISLAPGATGFSGFTGPGGVTLLCDVCGSNMSILNKVSIDLKPGSISSL